MKKNFLLKSSQLILVINFFFFFFFLNPSIIRLNRLQEFIFLHLISFQIEKNLQFKKSIFM